VNWIALWNRRRRTVVRRQNSRTRRKGNRCCHIESMEQRRMLHADPLLIGAVYTENDMGNDQQGDTFEVSFVGGAAGTQLTRIVIDGDQIGNYRNEPGLSSGDVFFDTIAGGQRVDNAFPFTLESVTDAQGVSKNGVVVTATVTDGGLDLIVDLLGMESGDILTFSIDVDEAENVDPRLSPAEQNLLFDPLTSGAEFHGSKLTAYFSAPNFRDVQANGTFINFYDSLAASVSSTAGAEVELPTDGERNNPDRTSGSFVHVHQTPLPVTIAGTVYHDRNRDLAQELGNGEHGIEGVSIELWMKDTSGQSIAVTTSSGNAVVTKTDSLGDYSFDASWNLLPGTYELREQHPVDYEVSVGAIPGTIEGNPVGLADNTNTLTLVELLQGGQDAVDYDFAEAKFAALSGFVYHDRDNDGLFETSAGEDAISGVTVQLRNEGGQVIDTTQTDGSGHYEFNRLLPATYSLLEVHPNQWIDGKDTLGSVASWNASLSKGDVTNDTFRSIALLSGDVGTNYNFGERLGSLAGRVHASNDQDCVQDADELGLQGVLIMLVDQDGRNWTTTTDASGDYMFDGLWAGVYTVIEEQPAGYFNGGQVAGTGGGDASAANRIADVQFGNGLVHLLDYNFCEHIGDISGFVYHDRDDDGLREPDRNEDGIPGVTLSLLDQTGAVIAQTTTDSQGFYLFDDLRYGTFTVLEAQPNGWIDGIDTPGFVAGVQVGNTTGQDDLRGIDLTSDSHGTEYNFGEYLAASIAGQVHTDVNNNCEFEPLASFPQPQQKEVPVSGVSIELYDASGNLVATSTTDALGKYLFDGLTPGEYTVVEIQPSNLFSVGEEVGSGTGVILIANQISEIQVDSGQHLVDYNFCEAPPASLSGFVFQDGQRIRTSTGGPPENLDKIRDGLLTPDDTRLSGVVLELRNGLNGRPIDASQALPGYYLDGPLRTVTDENGHYHFAGLARGNYAVYEIQPDGYYDSFDTAGTTSGRALNTNQPMPANLLAFAADPPPAFDAIIGIPLGYGQVSEQNNFSEVQTFTIVLPPQPPGRPRRPTPPTPETPPPAVVQHRPVDPVHPVAFHIPFYRGGAIDVSWHLSIVDAGAARGDGTATTTTRVREGTQVQWDLHELKSGQWTMPAADDRLHQLTFEHLFGHEDAIPVTGDFDGNGITEIGVYIRGDWFLDLNGNGRWDEGDLWLHLGSNADQPVTGDWDGDGKDDIGIFGPMWSGDPIAIEHDPGLPDVDNLLTTGPKNLPPRPEFATNGHRLMQKSSTGDIRADLIDHVFYFGRAGDIAIAGDWNGDGIDNIGVFRHGHWILDSDGDGRLTDRDQHFELGEAGDVPVVMDADGDGLDDVGFYRHGEVWMDLDHNREIDAHDRVFHIAGEMDSLFVGDFDGDGQEEVGRYRSFRADRHAGAETDDGTTR
jgi:protocatechuate 3,4-dioxygenase beta subunit